MHHHIKIQECYFYALDEWRKTHEVRYNDRDYQTWDQISFDVIYQKKWDYPDTSMEVWEITHVLHFPEWLQDGWVVLSLKKI